VPVMQSTGMNTVQAFFAAVSGIYAHYQKKNIDFRLGLALAGTSSLGALVASFLSANLSDFAAKLIYLVIACISLIMMLIPKKATVPKPGEGEPTASYSVWGVLPMGLIAGILAGLIGVGGGFILIPLLITVYSIPTRIAMGTTLLVILTTSLSAFAGKYSTGQVNLVWAFATVAGTLVGAQLGARTHHKLTPQALRIIFMAVLSFIILRVAIDLLQA
jgi:uncharacterized protein